MKFIALLAFVCLIAHCYTVSCAATQYCMGCSATNVCSTCFNWGSGSVGARSLASNTCTTALGKLATDAKMYSGSHTTTSTWTWSSALCKSNKYFVVDQSGGVAANYTGTCTSTLPTGATAVADCEYPGVNKTSASAATAYCLVCKKGKGGVSAYTSCAGTAIANCDYASGNGCHYCKSDYAVASTGLTCSAYTTDSNCRGLLSDGTCGNCWDAYYFNGTTCKLFGSILAASFAFLMALIH